LNNPSLHQRPTSSGSTFGVARLIRQVFVLREQGDHAGAARLEENEIPTAVRDHRLAHGPDALPDAELRALYAIEEQRVAEAAILSELLIPRLVKMLPAPAGPAPLGNNRSTVRTSTVISGTVLTPPGSPAISDLLDAMLAAERSGRQPVAAGKHES
jgi:hypothetical protein